MFTVIFNNIIVFMGNFNSCLDYCDNFGLMRKDNLGNKDLVLGCYIKEAF